MKKIITMLCLALSGTLAHAQNGLENVVVEVYYVSDANDSVVTDGISAMPGALPVGSVTYRIYADMLPGYKFQAAYGVDISPFGGAPSPGDHELRIETSTLFFNNEDRGAIHPTFTKSQAADNTVMLDSWLSVGAVCTGNEGILKSLDDGVATVVNNDGALQNNDSFAGIPLTVEDGFMLSAPEPVTDVGISAEIIVFDSQNDGTNGPVFSTWNGSWASLNGSVGPDTVDNKVLIAQITTDGVLCYELNIQIGTPSGGVENYVGQNPVGTELQLPSLMWCSNSVGVNEISSSNASFNVIPNPAEDFVLMHIDGKGKTDQSMSYSVYDITGKTVAADKISNAASDKQSLRIDISHLTKGLYYVALNIGGVVSVKKIIKN